MSQKVAELLSRLEKRLDRSAIVSADEAGPGYREDPDGKTGALPEFVLRPRKTGEVSDILRLCNEAGQRLVVQGGRTGLAGAARIQPGEAVLSLERMTAIETPDREAATIVAEAGAPLQMVQDAADTAGLLFGVDIGARGTATVGGNVATNAGGIRVLRYGMYRAQVLGLEAVLADGSILTSLKGLSKDNSGYDLNQLLLAAKARWASSRAPACDCTRSRPPRSTPSARLLRSTRRSRCLRCSGRSSDPCSRPMR